MDEKNKLDWMYKGASGLVDREDYLLGRTVDKTLEQLNNEEKEKKLGIVPPKNHVEHECIPPSIRDFNKVVAAEQVDLSAKLQEDPLVAIKKREEEARRQFLQNPVQLKKLQEALKAQEIKNKKKEKKKHKKSTDLDQKIIEKFKYLKDNQSVTGSMKKQKRKSKESVLDTILMHRFNELKDKLTEEDMKDIMDGRLSDSETDDENQSIKKRKKKEHYRSSSNDNVDECDRNIKPVSGKAFVDRRKSDKWDQCIENRNNNCKDRIKRKNQTDSSSEDEEDNKNNRKQKHRIYTETDSSSEEKRQGTYKKRNSSSEHKRNKKYIREENCVKHERSKDRKIIGSENETYMKKSNKHKIEKEIVTTEKISILTRKRERYISRDIKKSTRRDKKTGKSSCSDTNSENELKTKKPLKSNSDKCRSYENMEQCKSEKNYYETDKKEKKLKHDGNNLLERKVSKDQKKGKYYCDNSSSEDECFKKMEKRHGRDVKKSRDHDSNSEDERNNRRKHPKERSYEDDGKSQDRANENRRRNYEIDKYYQKRPNSNDKSKLKYEHKAKDETENKCKIVSKNVDKDLDLLILEKLRLLRDTNKNDNMDESSSDNDSTHKVYSGYDSDNPVYKKKTFGLVRADGTKIPLKGNYTEVKQIKCDKKVETFKKPDRKNTKRLTEAEKEHLRQQMMKDAEIREVERSENLRKYKEENKEENTREFNKNFVHKELMKTTGNTTVEDRIKSKLNSIQRSSIHMNSNFTKRS